MKLFRDHFLFSELTYGVHLKKDPPSLKIYTNKLARGPPGSVPHLVLIFGLNQWPAARENIVRHRQESQFSTMSSSAIVNVFIEKHPF